MSRHHTQQQQVHWHQEEQLRSTSCTSAVLKSSVVHSMLQSTSAMHVLSCSGPSSSDQWPSNAHGQSTRQSTPANLGLCVAVAPTLQGLSLDPLAFSIRAARSPTFGFPCWLRLLVSRGCRLVRISPSLERAGVRAVTRCARDPHPRRLSTAKPCVMTLRVRLRSGLSA